MGGINFEIEGMDDLLKGFEKIGGVPKKYVSGASKKAMAPALRRAKANAPEGETGNLKKGMKLTPESTKIKAKKVYRLVFDREYNDVFQKKNKSGKVTGYYPVSQEYGYFTKNGRFVPGFNFISDAFIGHVPNIEKTIVNELKLKIDKQIAKEGLK